MNEANSRDLRSHRIQKRCYRGRVRSGCLTCRARKVKCDEQQPNCHNCTRLERVCVYKPRKDQQPHSPASGAEDPEPTGSAQMIGDVQAEVAVAMAANPSLPARISQRHGAACVDTFAADNPEPLRDSIVVNKSELRVCGRQQKAAGAVSAMNDRTGSPLPSATLIPRDTEVTLTMDALASRELSIHSPFSFFLQEVDCPFITPYDSVNWRQMKQSIVELGISNEAVAAAILAVSARYKGQLYGLPLSKAISLYHSAKGAYDKLLDDRTQNFSVISAATFLLCLFEVTHYEGVPVLKEPSGVFTTRLSAWLEHEIQLSPLSSRIIKWLRLLHITAVRGGGMGLISDNIFSMLPDFNTGIENLVPPTSCYSDLSTHVYDMLSTPIFEFHYQLQGISVQIARLTHYYRSRTTGIDQEEVVHRIMDIESQLVELWGKRSLTQRQTPEEIHSCLAAHIANPIIKLVGVCEAAYYAEFIEMDRVLRDPISESTRSRQARYRIRDIVDGNWNVYDGDKLNPGYLRPLFLCAIECMDSEECQWAVNRLEKIKNPICRSDFFASFSKALSEAQLQKGRRITSKYFCIWYFGVSPPFL